MSNNEFKRPSFGIIQFIFFLIFGIGFTGVWLFADKGIEMDPGWATSSAKVVNFKTEYHVRALRNYYTPVYQYSINGQNYQIDDRFESTRPPAIGEIGEVFYNPNKPHQAKVVPSIGDRFFMLLLTPIIGIGLLIIAFILFVRLLKGKPPL